MKMKKIKNKILKILWSRLSRNLIFWTLFLGFWLYEERIPNDYAPGWYAMFRGIMFSLVIILSYFNNLFLVPKFLARKKYWMYIGLVIAFGYFISFCLALSFNIMMHEFPKMHIYNVSFITTDVPVSYTLKAMMEGAQNYFFFLLTWVCMFNMAWYMTDYARQQSVIEETRKKQMETELTFLKGQMNPHFLFNNLNNLYGLALKKSENTPGAILKLSSILRYLLYESDVERVSFEKEKEVMNAYIDLELLRLSNIDDLNFTITSDGSYNIPPLLWMPVLENVFKHATRVITDSYYIEYCFEIQNNLLTIYSKNNFKANLPKEKNGGIGLENLKKRLALLFPGKHEIHTSLDEAYFVTEVKINLA